MSVNGVDINGYQEVKTQRYVPNVKDMIGEEKMTEEDKSKLGKKSRASGAAFERKVRKDLESKGWIVDKWSNNVVLGWEYDETTLREIFLGKPLTTPISDTHLIPAKHKFRGVGIPMVMGTGFPDFICFKSIMVTNDNAEAMFVNEKGEKEKFLFDVIGVESKSNGYLTKEEKKKCHWYLKNNIFSKILIASKGEKRGEILYTEFKNI